MILKFTRLLINNSSDCIVLQSVLVEIHKWCTANSLFLNVDEWSVVIISLKNDDRKIKHSYTLENTLIPRSTFFFDFGVIFDKKWSFFLTCKILIHEIQVVCIPPRKLHLWFSQHYRYNLYTLHSPSFTLSILSHLRDQFLHQLYSIN